jgi:hypothetical protein
VEEKGRGDGLALVPCFSPGLHRELCYGVSDESQSGDARLRQPAERGQPRNKYQ